MFVDEIQRLPNLLNLPQELGESFELERVLRWGSIPLIWESADREQSLKAYVQLYSKEEIKAEALVRILPGFARFLPVAAAMHARQVSVSSAARDAEVGGTTLAGYLEILEDTLLAFRLPAYEARLRVRERRHPKLFWFDPGVVRAVAGRTGELHPQERGAFFEGWIAGLHRRLVVYAGSPSERSRRTEDGIDLWPVPVFLKHLQDSSFWD
ncbi:MAG: hypothetical protein A2064_11355 [Spirochaetes bacterium GWB1_66_5]|nr:MAG: hypothetical protein A2064_11355 [Spirochaetes bacterium GWB1_66_5]